MRRKRTQKASPREVFYCRLSARKLKNGETIDDDFQSQEELLRERFGKHPVYREIISGGKQRKVLEELIETLPEGSTIYCAHIDRLTRKSIYDLLSIIYDAKERKIKIVTLHDGDITTDEQEFILCAKAYVAQQERVAAQRRIADQRAAAERKGQTWGVWKAIEEGNWKWGTKEVNPAYVKGLPELVKLRERGFTYQQIADRFNQKHGTTLSAPHACRLIQKALNPPPPPDPRPKLRAFKKRLKEQMASNT